MRGNRRTEGYIQASGQVEESKWLMGDVFAGPYIRFPEPPAEQ